MLQINGKTFMNLQEAVQWLLDNNALPFQSSANYVANTEIGLGTIVNPSPAKVRIGSLIFFADSKVSTVTALTENGFMVSDQYNDLVDDITYVSNVELNASGHLIVTLSNGDTIDAGLIKQVTNFSISPSQHLIVNYNDGTSTDLGAIFSGNVNISGNLTADSIVENMSGYTFSFRTAGIPSGITVNLMYAGIVKNGNKLTFVIFGDITRTDTAGGSYLAEAFSFTIPYDVASKLYPDTIVGWPDVLALNEIPLFSSNTNNVKKAHMVRKSGNVIMNSLFQVDTLTLNEKYVFRIEQTFLLSDNLAS